MLQRLAKFIFGPVLTLLAMLATVGFLLAAWALDYRGNIEMSTHYMVMALLVIVFVRTEKE